MKYHWGLIFIFIFLNTELSNAQQDKDLQSFYADHIKANGVIVSTDVTAIPYVDIDRIAKFNFDSYRAYNTRQRVKLINGPIVELQSIQERLAEGKTIDQAIIDKKKDIASVTYKYEVMPKVDVKIGYKAPVKEREKTKIFMIPKDTN